MHAWILLSVAAALFQTLRFVLQKRLSMGALSAGGATFARFAYSMPLVVAMAGIYVWQSGGVMPRLGGLFWVFALTGGAAQIIATWCMITLFAARNFVVGMAFKKTEVVQAALVGLLVLGDRTGALGLAAMLLGMLGAVILSGGAGAARWRIFNRASALGLAAGALFAVSAVGYRGATLQIATDDAFFRALVTLACVVSAQAAAMVFWLGWREPGQIARVARAWRGAMWIGLTSLGGSLCLFTAFTLQNAAYVFALGQIEVIFSLMASRLLFGERMTAREGVGVVLITVSVMGVALLR